MSYQQPQEMMGGEYPPSYVYQPPPPQYGQPMMMPQPMPVTMPPGQPTMMMSQPVPASMPPGQMPMEMSQQMPYTMMEDPATSVPDNMLISIISVFFCCLIGPVAVFKAYNAKKKLRTGDIQSAQADAASAKKLAIAAILTGVVIICTVLIVVKIYNSIEIKSYEYHKTVTRHSRITVTEDYSRRFTYPE